MRYLCGVVIQVTLIAFARGQNSITLEECLRLASENSPQIRIADNAHRAAELSLSELKTTGLPQVKGIISASYIPIPPTFGYDPAISNGGQVGGQVVLQQSLFDAGIRSLKTDQLESDMGRFQMERRLAQQDLILAIRQSFVEGLRAQEETALQRQSVRQLDGYLDLVQRLNKGGGASYTDLLKTQMQAFSAQLALEKAVESTVTAKLALAELVGVPLDTSVHLEGSLSQLSGQAADTLVAGREADIATTLDMSIASLSVQRSLLDHDIASHERLPEISIFADAGYLTSGENLRLPAVERVNAFGYSVGIGVEVPLLNWGATTMRIQQRELATEDLRQKMEILRRSLLTDASRSRLQLARARDRLTALRVNVAKAEENFLLTKAKYAAGGTLALEVLTAQQLLTEFRLSELHTLAEIQSLVARLQRLHVH